MTGSSVKDIHLRNAIAAERQELAEVLKALPTQLWDTQSLCAGWRVREVVAHMTMPFRYSTQRFVIEVVKARGSFNRMADRCARRDAELQIDELVASLRDNIENPWKPPGGGFEGALAHDVIHGLDITVALRLGRSFGSGTPVFGLAQDLALVISGRKLPAGLLQGAAS
jgi:uncharacterized protein (TIGR03083 family)